MADTAHPPDVLAPPNIKQDIEALIDGELDERQARALRRVIDNDPALQCRFHALILQKTLLKTWWQHVKPYKN